MEREIKGKYWDFCEFQKSSFLEADVPWHPSRYEHHWNASVWHCYDTSCGPYSASICDFCEEASQNVPPFLSVLNNLCDIHLYILYSISLWYCTRCVRNVWYIWRLNWSTRPNLFCDSEFYIYSTWFWSVLHGLNA